MILQINNLKKYYGEGQNRTCVLKGIDMRAAKSSVNVILGPSGSGKSTLLNIIGGIDTLDDGDVIVDGDSLRALKKREFEIYRRKNIGFVFQSYNLVPNLTVIENIEVCQQLASNPIDITELIGTLGISDHKHKFPRQLSGGQQQRTAIARALVKNPPLLLCDEPTGALDYESSKGTLKLLDTVNKKYGTTMVIVTHNQAIALMAHQVLRMRDGLIVDQQVNESPASAEDIEW